MTEIDDEMVKRAMAYAKREWCTPDAKVGTADQWASFLAEVLNPKPEPEIEVSEGMVKIAQEVYHENRDGPWHELWRRIYRAMESTRLKETAYAAKDASQGVSSGAPVNETRAKVVTKFYGINRL